MCVCYVCLCVMFIYILWVLYTCLKYKELEDRVKFLELELGKIVSFCLGFGNEIMDFLR